MLVELGLVEQRLKAVHEVLDGALVVDVAERYGVVRQTVHVWLKNFATSGMAGLVDKTSRFIVSAHVMRRATARPVCDGLAKAMRTWGVPEEVLTDNGNVFTSRLGPGNGDVLFDRIPAQNGIKHRLTAPYSPTTTSKVERWHKTLRSEFLTGKVFESTEDAQAAVDGWVREYNEDRPHQGIGGSTPWERFRLSQTDQPLLQVVEAASVPRYSTGNQVRCRSPDWCRRTGRSDFWVSISSIPVW